MNNILLKSYKSVHACPCPCLQLSSALPPSSRGVDIAGSGGTPTPVQDTGWVALILHKSTIPSLHSGEHECCYCVGLSKVLLHAAGLAPAAAAGQLRYKTFFKRDFPPKEVLTSHQQLSFFLHLDQVLPWCLETARSA